MSNLLSIEENFLSNSDVKAGLKIVEFKKLNTQVTNASKARFNKSLELGRVMAQALEWFKTPQAKAKFKDAGIVWTTEDLFEKVFGMKKAFSYKLIKAAELPIEKVEEFMQHCDQQAQEGIPHSQSIENLIKFANGEDTTEPAERAATVFTLSWKNEHGAVAVRVDENGQVVTKNGAAQIADAIAFLQASLHTLENQPVK